MKCDTPGCLGEGRNVDKTGVYCWECNDKNLEDLQSKQWVETAKKAMVNHKHKLRRYSRLFKRKSASRL
jgi:hypothetical protein